jgi:hypothetical protein
MLISAVRRVLETIFRVGKQEVGIWWVQKRFPRYGVPIWSLWPNIRFLPSIVAEKNATKNGHIQNVCPCSSKGDRGILFYLCPFVQDIFLSNCWWQKSDIWSQASYRYTILWVAFLDPSDSYLPIWPSDIYLGAQMNILGAEMTEVTWICLTPPHFCVCPKLGLFAFLFFVFNDLRWEVVVSLIFKCLIVIDI